MTRMTQKMVAMLMAIIMSACMCLSTQAQAINSFSDVPTTHWAYQAIGELAMRNVVKGVGAGKFNPNGTVSNAEFVTMFSRLFYRAAIDSETQTFPKWWGVGMYITQKNGLLEGTAVSSSVSDFFGVSEWDETGINAVMTRNDMAMVMYNYLSLMEKLPSQESMEAAKSSIPDFGSIPESHKNAVASVYALGYLTGVDSTGQFSGSGTVSRAQAAVVLWRLYQPLIVENKDVLLQTTPQNTNTSTDDVTVSQSAGEDTPDTSADQQPRADASESPTVEPTTPTTTEGSETLPQEETHSQEWIENNIPPWER